MRLVLSVSHFRPNVLLYCSVYRYKVLYWIILHHISWYYRISIYIVYIHSWCWKHQLLDAMRLAAHKGFQLGDLLPALGGSEHPVEEILREIQLRLLVVYPKNKRRVLAPSKNGGWPWDFWTINSIISWAFDGFSTRGAIGVLQIVNYMACQDTSWHSVASITWRRQAADAGYLEAQESLEIAQHESFWASKPGFPFQQIISGWCSPEM